MAATDNTATGGTDPTEHPPNALIEATTALLSAVTAITLPLELPTAEPARRARTEIEHILTAAILPRLRTPDAPLLCALAGPTGVGKSTLLNALAGATLSATGPLRPTTRAAVLVCHPGDLAEAAGLGAAPVEVSMPADEKAPSEESELAEADVMSTETPVPDEALAATKAPVTAEAAIPGEEMPDAEPAHAKAPEPAEGPVPGAEPTHAKASVEAERLLPATEPARAEAAESTEELVPSAEAAHAEPPERAEGLVSGVESAPAEGPERPAEMPVPSAESARAEASKVSEELVPSAEPAQAGGSEPADELVPGAESAQAEASEPVALLVPGAESARAEAAEPAEELVPGTESARAKVAERAEVSAAADEVRGSGEWGRAGGVEAGLGARVGGGLGSLLASPLPSPSLPRGVALVDTVDGDVAVVGAADVVVVVVSAERYADAAVWRVLRRVGGLGVPVVVVLGRVAAGVVEEVSGAFVELLRVNGLGAVPFFVVEEVGGGVSDSQGGAWDSASGSAYGGALQERHGGAAHGEEADGRGPGPGARSLATAVLSMDGGQGEGTAGVGGGAPGEGGYGDGGLGRAGGPAGGTGIEIGGRDGDPESFGSEPEAEVEAEGGIEVGSGDTAEAGLGPASASVTTSGAASGAGIGDTPPLVPQAAVAGLLGWLRDAGADTAGRVRIGTLGVAGRLDSVDRLVQELADAWEGQRLALQVLHQGLERVHTAERVRFRGAVDAGELLGGEVRIRWQELLGSGRVSALFGADDGGKKSRRRKRAEADWSARFHNPTAHDAATAPLRAALVESVARGYRGALERAARKTSDLWELTPGAPEAGIADDAARRAGDPARAAAEWLDHLPAVILDQAHSRRTTRTIGPAGAHIRSAALVLGVAALAGGGTPEAGAEATPEDDPAATAAVGLLHTMFGPEAADRLLTAATTSLKDGNARLLDRAAESHRAQLAAYALDPRQAQALADARAAVARARNEED